MALQVLQAGMLTLLQDYGRFGYQRIGVTNGGPIDEHAFLWANRLLGNNFDSPQLEITYGGFSAEFTEPTLIAICGADLDATINNNPITPWQSYNVVPGDKILFKGPKNGMRAYMAIKGGFAVEKQLASCSTVMREKLGGLHQNGEKISEKDTLSYQASDDTICRRVPERFIRHYGGEINLRFIPRKVTNSFSPEQLTRFTTSTYEVSQNIDRMGYRLTGNAITADTSKVISFGIALGSIQIPKDGQPIVLMCDRQTIGGYPIIGCVSRLDISLLAQSMPGTKVNFIASSTEDLELELMLHYKFFDVSF